MKCPHCLHDIHPSSATTNLNTYNSPVMVGGNNAGNPLAVIATVHTCPKCKGATVELTFHGGSAVYSEMRSYPRSGSFPPAPPDVPKSISMDYSEANEVLPISPKASAALSRRCLQGILSSHSYTGRDLVKQIDSALSETDASKSLPASLRDNIDAIRNFGNFSAHPITDQTTLQIVDVEQGEAEWCLQILLDLFDHYYVAPARSARLRASLAAKLVAAGKPPMKS